MSGPACGSDHGSLLGHRGGDRERARAARLALRAARAARRPARDDRERDRRRVGDLRRRATGRRSTRSPRACSRGTPPSRLLVNNAGVPGRGTFVSTSPETIERVIETNYLGGVWCTRAFLPGLRSAAAARRRAHRERRLRRRDDRVRAGRPVRGLEARAARVLPLAHGDAASRGDPGAHALARVRRDGGLHSALEPPQRSHAPIRARRRRRRPGDREGGREGTQGDDGALVPLPARSRSSRRSSRASSRGSSGATATARARRTSAYMPGLAGRRTSRPRSRTASAGAGPRIR